MGFRMQHERHGCDARGMDAQGRSGTTTSATDARHGERRAGVHASGCTARGRSSLCEDLFRLHRRPARRHREHARGLRRAADAAPASRSIDLFAPATQSSSSARSYAPPATTLWRAPWAPTSPGCVPAARKSPTSPASASATVPRSRALGAHAGCYHMPLTRAPGRLALLLESPRD
jgi:hypothetical protein